MQITTAAAEKIKEILNNLNKPQAGIRIFATQGCCGSSVQMDVSDQQEADETVVSIENINFFVEKELLQTLTAVTIEYGKNGFKFKGLNNNYSCCDNIFPRKPHSFSVVL